MQKGRMGTVAGAGVGGAFAAASGIAMMVSSPASTGCTTHQCDPSTADFPARTAVMDGAPTAGGFMIDQDTFVTSSLDGTWVEYPANGTLRILFPPEVACRMPLGPPSCYVGVAPSPISCAPSPNAPSAGDGGINYAQASGQLAEFNDLNTVRTDTAAGTFGGSFVVRNATCQLYCLWCRVDFVPQGAMPSLTDGACAGADAEAEAEAEASSADAASVDAATE
jgi:hypothetical protein